MAYNPAMYNTYGNMYGYGQGGYQAPMQQMQPMSQQSYAPQPVQQAGQGMIWVDGEVGAKAYQIPGGWPANTPIALWDTNDTIIYLKSTNQMGMPNPLQKITYQMEESVPKYLGAGSAGRLMSGDQGGMDMAGGQDMSQYVRKDELGQMKTELDDIKSEIMQSLNEMRMAAQTAGQNVSQGTPQAATPGNGTTRRTAKGE